MTVECQLDSKPNTSSATAKVYHQIEELASCTLPISGLGDFTLKAFHYPGEVREHLALIKELPGIETPLVRIHSECLTGDVFSSMRCDCGPQLNSALAQIAEQGGVLLYMRQEGRGIGLVNKIKAYALQQEHGLDTVQANHHLGFPADGRNYLVSALILKHLGIDKVDLITNNPLKVSGLTENGIIVNHRVGILTKPNKENSAYLNTKKNKLGHFLSAL